LIAARQRYRCSWNPPPTNPLRTSVVYTALQRLLALDFFEKDGNAEEKLSHLRCSRSPSLMSFALQRLSSFQQLLGACLVSGVAAIAGSPFDVAKTRIQAGLLDAQGGYALRTIVREEGFFALFKGVRPKVARITLGAGRLSPRILSVAGVHPLSWRYCRHLFDYVRFSCDEYWHYWLDAPWEYYL
jgi:hypothetical protein